MASRQIPAQPSLTFDRKRAKRLLRAARAGDAAARAEFVTHHPRFARQPELLAQSVALHDAELVVARQYGFASWPQWKQLVEARLCTRAEQAALLVRAACSNDVRRARVLLEADPTLSTVDLYSACVTGNVGAAERELQRVSASAAGGPLGWPPIVYACFSRLLRRDAERARSIVQIVRLLLERGADPSACYLTEATPHEPAQRQTCLYAASGIANHAELTRLLLEAGADIHEGLPEPGAGSEALYHASEFKDVSCLRLLLQARPYPALVSYCLQRCLDLDNEAGVLLYLEHGADPNLSVPWGHSRTALHKAVLNGRSLITLRALLARGADPQRPDASGISPYRHAVRLGAEAAARLLEAHGALPELLTAEDRALARIAAGQAGPDERARHERGTLARLARSGNLRLVERLLEAGANIDEGADMPPLHNACYAGRLEAVQLLLQRGADLNRRSAYGGDALDSALYGSENCCDPEGGPGTLSPEEITHGDYAGIVECLLQAGATPPAHVCGSEPVREVLRRFGVSDAPE